MRRATYLEKTRSINRILGIQTMLASPEKIRSWSHGEVTKPETINYRTFKPEKDGLFCAKIFGPVNDWECLCGKYKRMKYRGITCEKCGVEVIQSKVRRERNGHIDLAAPVSHIWFLKGTPSRISILLALKLKDVESVNYYEQWVVADGGSAPADERQLFINYYKKFCSNPEPKKNDSAKNRERVEDNIAESLTQFEPPPGPLLFCAQQFSAAFEQYMVPEALFIAKSLRELYDLPKGFYVHVLKDLAKGGKGKALDERIPKNPIQHMQFFSEVMESVKRRGYYAFKDPNNPNEVDRKNIATFFSQKIEQKRVLSKFLSEQYGIKVAIPEDIDKGWEALEESYTELFRTLLEDGEERKALLEGYRRALLDRRSEQLTIMYAGLKTYASALDGKGDGQELPNENDGQRLPKALHELFRRDVGQPSQEKAFHKAFGRAPGWKKDDAVSKKSDVLSKFFDLEEYTLQVCEQISSVKEDFLNPPQDEMEGQFYPKYKSLLMDRTRDVFKDISGVSVQIGAQGIQELMKHLSSDCQCTECLDKKGSRLSRIECLRKLLREYTKAIPNNQKRANLNKRLKLAESFIKSGNKPEWMILNVLPVIPPELRPLVPLDGGRFATSDLNDLYRRVINRNNRLKKLMEMRAPDVIVRNEKRMLQEAVDALFDNGRRGRILKGTNNRPLKSLSDTLKGKQGRFRQNLLGKRVDYSGRSVIVVGPDLKLNQCGLPKIMALELFKPFIFNKLEERGFAPTIKQAKEMVEAGRSEVYDILEEVIQNHVVLLNRAPTLHRLGIQAFEPVLVEGKAIKLHPLVCSAFNADFDGDQMAVHVPLSPAAQVEGSVLMLSTNNLLYPANGTPIVVPTQDMVLGVYYLTNVMPGALGEGKRFASADEVVLAYANNWVGLHAQIKLRYTGEVIDLTSLLEDQDISHTPAVEYNRRYIDTTVGRVLFNNSLPKEVPFINGLIKKKGIKDLFSYLYLHCGKEVLVQAADMVKDLGFTYATKAGISFGIDDMVVPPAKKQLVEKAQEEVEKVEQQRKDGAITDRERKNKVVDIWNRVTDDVANAMFKKMTEAERQSKQFNPIFIMADSGARGSKQQIRQLAGMRGLMAKPSGDIIEQPITANFREGLNVLQYFISSHGARKGLADTALKTADSGYLTRRLVDVSQDVIISEEDCFTLDGIFITPLMEGGRIIEPIRDRIVGRVALDDIDDPYSKATLVKANEEITEEKAQAIQEAGLESVKIRSVLTCQTKRGVCARCYGRNLATGQMVEMGEAIGVMAAQSIGEPGTQLTMRTFHIGGTASKAMVETSHIARSPGTVRFRNVKTIENPEGGLIVISRAGAIVVEDLSGREREKHQLVYGAHLRVGDGDELGISNVTAGIEGEVAKVEFPENTTVTLIKDATTGRERWVVTETVTDPLKEKKGQTKAVKVILKEDGKKKVERSVPLSLYLSVMVREGDKVLPDTVLIKSQDASVNTTLVEWDPYTNPILADVEGEVHFKDIIDGVTISEEPDSVTGLNQRVVIESKDLTKEARILLKKEGKKTPRSIPLPSGAHLMVEEGLRVFPGTVLAKIPRAMSKTKDIVGGLPRVVELFEARHPKSPSVITEIDGEVHYGEIIRAGIRKIIVDNERTGERREYSMPKGVHISVLESEWVHAGDPLCDGPIDPHDILRVLGIRELQRYIVNEIQEVYRLQGVNINDKHIETIVRQMIRWMRVEDPGDTNLLMGQQVDRFEFYRENEKIRESNDQVFAEEEKKKSAVGSPQVLGITKAALATDSWISAAAFQETTRVLTESAVSGSTDYLRGLKENVILGRLIPAGTGYYSYHDVEIDADPTVKPREELLRERQTQDHPADEEQMMQNLLAEHRGEKPIKDPSAEDEE